jgi:hypothetical protein
MGDVMHVASLFHCFYCCGVVADVPLLVLSVGRRT